MAKYHAAHPEDFAFKNEKRLPANTPNVRCSLYNKLVELCFFDTLS